MSLGTGALMDGRKPERLRHSKEVSMATLRAGTTPACSRQLAPSRHTDGNSVDPILTNVQTQTGEGMGGSQNPQRSAQNASKRRNVKIRCKISKSPCSHPTDHVRLRRRPMTALACNVTLPKLYFAT